MRISLPRAEVNIMTAAFTCANRFPALPAVLDTAREPVYALRRGRNKIPLRIRKRPKPRAEKKMLIIQEYGKCPSQVQREKSFPIR